MKNLQDCTPSRLEGQNEEIIIVVGPLLFWCQLQWLVGKGEIFEKS